MAVQWRLNISIHFLYTEEDHGGIEPTEINTISIHFLYTEEDQILYDFILIIFHFNPLPLYRGRHGWKNNFTAPNYFNPLPLYRGRLISVNPARLQKHFNPLPLYRGRHLTFEIRCRKYLVFQSTSSIQRKTNCNFNIQSYFYISIHFLYTEEDI